MVRTATLVTRLALDHPRLAFALLGFLTLGFGGGLLRLETQVGFRGFLGEEHAAIRALDSFVARFGGGLPAAAVWSCEELGCETVFDPPSLRMAASVARALEDADGVLRVESPATSALLVPATGGLRVQTFADADGARERAKLIEQARSDPFWVGRLISEDARVGAVVVEHSSSAGDAARGAIRALEEALAPFEAEGFRFHRVGPVLELVLAEEELAADALRVIPAMAGIVLVVFLVLFRSATIAALGLGVASVAPLWALGLCGWLGWPRNAILQALPPVLLVIATCHVVHWLSRHASRARQAPGVSDPRTVQLAVAEEIARPAFLTAATTAAGFLSFLTSGVQSFVRFGIAAAFGVAAAWVVTFTLLPLLLARVRATMAHREQTDAAWERTLTRLVSFNERHRAGILLAGAGVALVAGAGMTRLRVDVHPYELVGRDSQVVRWASFVAAHLREPDALEIELVLPANAELHEPEITARLAELERFLIRQPGVARVRSIEDALARMRELIGIDSSDSSSAAIQAGANAELLLLLSLNAEGLLRQWVSLDRRRIRVSAEVAMDSQERQEELLRSVRAHLAERFPATAGWETGLNGPLWARHQLIEEVQRTQIWSFATAGITVSLLLAAFFRSAGWALLGMLPSVLPVLLTLGTLGALGLPLDIGGAMVAAVVLGIAVDDTIYLLSRYRTERAAGQLPDRAMRAAVLHVGRAVTTTSIALTLGFLALRLSHIQSIAHFGLLSGITIAAAWVADLVLLPALASIWTRKR